MCCRGRCGPPRRNSLNSDGDDVVFHTVSFPMMRTATTAAVQRKLQEIDQLHQENSAFWNWVKSAPAKMRAKREPQGSEQPAIRWNVTLDDGSIVLGNLEITGRTIVLSTNSAARAERGSAMLSAALSGLVGAPTTTTETIEQVKVTRRSDAPATIPPIPAELQTKLVHEMLDRQYRDILSEHYAGIRRWAPAFLATFEFQSVPAAASLMRAIAMLRAMNSAGTTTLPKSAPTAFMQPRWARHVPKRK